MELIVFDIDNAGTHSTLYINVIKTRVKFKKFFNLCLINAIKHQYFFKRFEEDILKLLYESNFQVQLIVKVNYK